MELVGTCVLGKGVEAHVLSDVIEEELSRAPSEKEAESRPGGQGGPRGVD